METKLLAPSTELTASYVPEIKEKQIHRGKQFIYPENLPAWEVWHESLLALATRTSSRTKTEHAFSMLIAAHAWGIPAHNFPLQLDVIYFDDRRRGTSKVGELAGRGGLPVHRFNRKYPADAWVQQNGLRVLDYPYFLLELLQLDDAKQALVTADALVRKVLQVEHSLSEIQQRELAKLRATVVDLARQYFTEAVAQRVQRRCTLMNPLAESALETLVRVDLVRAGVPGLVCQFPIFSEGGHYYADLCLPAQLLVIECDGQEKYMIDPQRTYESNRQKALENLGFRVIRVSWEQANTPGYLSKVARSLGIRLASGLWRW
ncbi:DUF559 domain-containing protein [Gleimia sp. 6138-11-ORH1]|uniref:endonuclease domain-containing protein n=1 Tax=Gleimia sp. 6138-11-ORH1 TaxID=2973937 RepID=UPI002169F4DD|nr:DUF559 domain-containing protein [Gleimia sp. 6138-11-ORH1]MCS4483936.1 DUF559 domain-containing protein [Gleimia sp. 6138-11-ORH1]